jgi:hypothetical protein
VLPYHPIQLAISCYSDKHQQQHLISFMDGREEVIKLKLPLQTAILYAKNDPNSAYAQAALVAHAYQEAISSGRGKTFSGAMQFAAWIDQRVAEILKSWGVE